MTTTTMVLTDTWTQITDGTQDYAVHVGNVLGDNTAKLTLSDTTPTSTTPAFSVAEGEGITSVTHPGKVWARKQSGDNVILVINK